MKTTANNFESERKDVLNRIFDIYRDDAMRKKALKLLRFLVANDEPLLGRPGG